ncbi:alpha/beta hydrolase [Krasilnikovia sp. M28-CT-15]|uniref:alpha/beta hydrolase n=1 Tax=Krasilnikovia sp. M28-CT-15 TaxID=3373540 RepID=UPI00387704BC
MSLRPGALLSGMPSRRSVVRLTSGVVAAVLAVALAAPVSPAAAAGGARPDRTSAVEAHRVDRVPTPGLGWYHCFDYAECATVHLPLDYDQPAGAQVELAVLRVKARDQRHRIGTLFVNPGGPGGQGTAIAYYAPFFLGDGVLDRFDIVGFDPRGIGFSDNAQCFRSAREQDAVLSGLNVPFPFTRPEVTAYVAAAEQYGRACSSTGRPLSDAMSTAEAARDMDVLRRAVGDQKLTYLGFSYGTALGQYYANMFPDRVRALALDGVINPISWTGTAATRDMILDDRLRSADGAYKALHEILVRCDRAGGTACVFAVGDPVANFALIARRLRAAPLVYDDPVFGPTTVTYADFVAFTLANLYDPGGYDNIVTAARDLLVLTEPPAGTDAAARGRARHALTRQLHRLRDRITGRDFPYDNSLDAFLGVTCTDTRNPRDAASWPARTAASDRRAPYFGRAWAWSTVGCARDTWTVRDEDAYTGPFDRRTAAPVLFVGDYYDPATNYLEAVGASRLLPGSRLLSSDSWGHTAYGTSACVTDAVDAYLLRQELPPAGTVCTGDIQPFTGVPPAAQAAATHPVPSTGGFTVRPQPARNAPKHLPPVSPRIPSIAPPGR